jgi:hypothetical protein
MTQQAPSRTAVTWIGLLFMAVGLGTIVMMTVSPEGLNAPYWVAVAAASTFVLAGASVVANAWGLGWLFYWIAPILLVGLATPGLWILVAPGEQHCTASVNFVASAAGDLTCRAVFGLGGALVLAIALFAVARLVRGRGRPRRTDKTADRSSDGPRA